MKKRAAKRRKGAGEYYDSLLHTDANSPIDKHKQRYSQSDLLRFAEAYSDWTEEDWGYRKLDRIDMIVVGLCSAAILTVVWLVSKALFSLII